MLVRVLLDGQRDPVVFDTRDFAAFQHAYAISIHKSQGATVESCRYAMEELVAEMGSVQLAMETGLPSQIDNHASYVDHWLKVLKADKKALFVAAAKASQSVDFVMGRPAMTAEARQVNTREAARQVVRDVVKSAPLNPPITPQFPAAGDPAVPPTVAVVAKLRARRAKQQAEEAAPEVTTPKRSGMRM